MPTSTVALRAVYDAFPHHDFYTMWRSYWSILTMRGRFVLNASYHMLFSLFVPVIKHCYTIETLLIFIKQIKIEIKIFYSMYSLAI